MLHKSSKSRVRTATTLLASVACVLMATPSNAIQLFGYTFFESNKLREVQPGETIYTLEFDVGGLPETVQTDLQNASQLFVDKDTPILNSAGLLSRASGDYRRFLAELYAAGYYAGDISILINGREAASIPLTATLPKANNVTVRVNPGQIFTFGQTSIDPVPDQFMIPADFQRGAVAYAGVIQGTSQNAVDAWRQDGHALAAVADREIVADHPNGQLDASIRIAPGPRLSFGPVSITGNKRVDTDFIRYMADIPMGETFDPDDLEIARERLIGLGVFRAVSVSEGEQALPGDQIAVDFDVTEMLPRRYGIGVTLSNVDGAGISAYWLHRNLFGRAESLRVEFSVDRIGIESDLESYDYTLGASFTKPGVFTPNTDFHLSANLKHYEFEGILSRNLELATDLTNSFGNLDISGGVFASYSDINDDFGFRSFRIVGADLGASWDNRNDRLDPTSGFYADLTLRPFNEFVFDNQGVHTSFEVRGYQRLSSDGRFRVAERFGFGSLIGMPGDEAPADMLFFAGGSETVRGYDFQSIGIDYGGNFGGGLSVISLGAELRADITDTIGVVAFFDAASVGAGTLPTGSDEWFSGAGIGLRYNTGFGPLRLDIARGLNLRPGDPEYAIYVGLGQAF